MIRLSELRRREMEHDISAPTRLDFHALQFVIEGAGAHWVDFVRHSLKRGDILQVRSDQVHAFDADSEHEALLLLFRPETVRPEPMRRLSMHLNAPFHPADADFSAVTQLIEFIQNLERGNEEGRLSSMAPGLLDAIISGLDDLLVRDKVEIQESTHHRASELVFRFENLLLVGSLRQPVSDYTSRLAVSQKTLARACHTVRGRSPKQLVDQHFALAAKRNLILSDDTIEEIAFALGFSEATNFVKFFKRIAGTTPEAFRQEQRKA